MVAEQTRVKAGYTPDETCEDVGICKRHFWKLVEDGKIPVIRLSPRSIRVPGSWMQAFYEGRVEL